jgi:hypothetical protein
MEGAMIADVRPAWRVMSSYITPIWSICYDDEVGATRVSALLEVHCGGRPPLYQNCKISSLRFICTRRVATHIEEERKNVVRASAKQRGCTVTQRTYFPLPLVHPRRTDSFFTGLQGHHRHWRLSGEPGCFELGGTPSDNGHPDSVHIWGRL